MPHLVPKHVSLIFELLDVSLTNDAAQQLMKSMDTNGDEVVDRRDVDAWIASPEMSVVPYCSYYAVLCAVWKARAVQSRSKLLYFTTIGVASLVSLVTSPAKAAVTSIVPLSGSGSPSRGAELTVSGAIGPGTSLDAASSGAGGSLRCRRCSADASLFRPLRQCAKCSFMYCDACCASEVIALNERNETVRTLQCVGCVSGASHEATGGLRSDVALWDADQSTALCTLCSERFTLLRRRHHCRRCGAVVCGSCSANSIPIPGYVKPQRVCNVCHSSAKSTTAFPVGMQQGKRGAGAGVQRYGDGDTDSTTTSTSATSPRDGAVAGRSHNSAGMSVTQILNAAVLRGVPRELAASQPTFAALPEAKKQQVLASRKRMAQQQQLNDVEYELPWRDTYDSDTERAILRKAAAAIRVQLSELAILGEGDPVVATRALHIYEQEPSTLCIRWGTWLRKMSSRILWTCRASTRCARETDRLSNRSRGKWDRKTKGILDRARCAANKNLQKK